ncbi:MAG: amidohydrolase family protein [Acidobacteriota bacterium]
MPKLETAYRRLIAPGFYRKVLQEVARIESCQVNYLGAPFMESEQPLLLMQDLKFVGMHIGPNIDEYAPKAGIQVKDLTDWHRVIDWWFSTYAPYAVAIQSQAAYSRGLDYEEVPTERAAPVMRRKLDGDPISDKEKKALEDHLFWYVIRKATGANLPVKLHTGYYAGENQMPLGRVSANPASASELCRKSPDTRFVFMHIGYP